MGDMRTEEAERSGERSTDGFGVGAEGGDLVASGVVGGDELDPRTVRNPERSSMAMMA